MLWKVVGERAERTVAVDELLQTLVLKTGLPEDTIRQALPMLSGFLKSKAPPEASGAIDQYLGSQPPVEGISSVQDAGGLATFMSERLGIPKETAATIVTTAGGFLKDKLPPPANEMVGGLLGVSQGGGFMDTIKGFFGGGGDTPHA
jgi:hypothetical protein